MLRSRPGTRLGWWSVGLAATFVLLFIINQALFVSDLRQVQPSWQIAQTSDTPA